MRLTSAVKKVEQHLLRVPVVGELRISTSDQCSRCRSRRKTLVASLGWICTTCFDRCKEKAEKLVVERNAVHRIPEAYERAILSYSKLDLRGFDADQLRTRIDIKGSEVS
jgi:ribosomal protein L37AE/L43A